MTKLLGRLYFLVVLCYFHSSVPLVAASIIDDIGLSITEYVSKYGYPIETHEVQTEDGYILTFHRVPHGKNDGNSTKKKPVVFLMHGILSSNMDWFNIGPEKGLGFLLADAGYDVWLGLQRGSTLNKRHITLDPVLNASQFWDFGFYEIAVYDTVSYIDYILNYTGVENIYYIGYSQGNVLFYVLMSSKPIYNKYIKLAIHLGPVAFLKHSPHPILNYFNARHQLMDIVGEIAGKHEFLPHWPLITELAKTLCVDGSAFQVTCAEILYAFGGVDREQMNMTILPVIFSSIPAGASFRQILHVLQAYKSGKFSRYDYGVRGNLAKYGTPKPPGFNLTKITAPVVLISAEKDLLCNPVDVDHLESLLSNVVARKTVPFEDFTHLDFLWAKDVVELVYNDVLQFLKNSEQSQNTV